MLALETKHDADMFQDAATDRDLYSRFDVVVGFAHSSFNDGQKRIGTD
jgi:hypothetical protein